VFSPKIVSLVRDMRGGSEPAPLVRDLPAAPKLVQILDRRTAAIATAAIELDEVGSPHCVALPLSDELPSQITHRVRRAA
jgi:hypothetical protein